MSRSSKQYLAVYDHPETPRSLYDPPDEDQDLWFLPGPDDAPDDHEIPLPRANAASLVRPGDWIAAQGKHAAQLARAALAVGQLDMVVAQIGPGALERLALREVESLTWTAGVPISIEEIGRDQLLARVSTDLEGLHQARWAVRRLIGGGPPTGDLRKFLGLQHRVEAGNLPDDLQLRLSGDMFDEAAQEFLARVAEMEPAHVFTRGAYARHLWQLLDLSPEKDPIEGAVWAARYMARSCQVLTFVPLGQGAQRLQGTGLAAFGPFLRAIEQAATNARAELQRLNIWHDRALEQTAPIKGTNPARIIDALMAKPLATTEMIEQSAGISRDTAERLLARMQDMGLVREVTGASRFRIWAAKA